MVQCAVGGPLSCTPTIVMLATPDALLFMQLRHIVLWPSRKRGEINLESYRDNISLVMSGRLIAGDSDGSDQYIGIREDMSKISASAIYHTTLQMNI
eukprot:scaffold14417_cov76-Skeletonema_dohrnii-CCMP3373.AAC.4